MAETKLSRTKIPNTKGVLKPKKLGLLTKKERAILTLRMKSKALERLNDLIDYAKKHISHKLCRTDLLEALILWATKLNSKQLTELFDMLNKDEK